MLCDTCHQRPALTRNGEPARLVLFGRIEGYFCAHCALEHQVPFNAELRRSIAERAPSVTDEDLAAVPDQMLKFTMCFPLPNTANPDLES